MTGIKPSAATAVAKIEQAPAGEQLTVAQRKAFLEVAARGDLDKLDADQQRGALIAFGRHTGLRPELGEAMIYQGRIYVTMLGRIRNAHALGLFDGMQARPAGELARRQAGYEDDDVVWICDVWRRGSSRPFRGWGKVTKVELQAARAGDKTRYTPVARHPVEMARKRAEYDALRLAFPLDEELTDLSRRFIEAAETEATVLDQDGAAGHVEDAAADAAAGREIEDAAAASEPAKGPAPEISGE